MSDQVDAPPPPYTEASRNQTVISGIGSISSSTPEFQVSISEEDAGKSLLVTITPPKTPKGGAEKEKRGKRAPLDLCLVIDVSGSMQGSAPPPGNDPKEDTGLSVLDVVKHAVKTIIGTMQDDDRLAIVSFSDNAKVVSNFAHTTDAGKTELLKATEGLHTESSTNLWDGLKVGLNLLDELQASKETNKNRLSSLFLMTDGQPTEIPPRGHIPMLNQWLDAHPTTETNISTFGFAYRLDSALLSEIAIVGNGGYGFIPDAGMVGTVFVHAVANLFSTYATRCTLNIEIPEESGAKLKKPLGSFPVINTSWGATIDVGDLQYGQSRAVILSFDEAQRAPPLTLSVVAKPWNSYGSQQTITATFTPSASPRPKSTDACSYHMHRLRLVDSMFAVCANEPPIPPPVNASNMTLLQAHEDRFRETATKIKATLQSNSDALALAGDIGGEVALAVSDETAWKKWGRHYFPSLARSHQRQQCSNFKDPGLQIYGRHSPLFTESRDAADAIFDKLPPPKPSIAPSRSRGTRVAVGSMSRWHRSSAPCFPGYLQVTGKTNTHKIKLCDLQRGDLIKTCNGTRKVQAILKTVIPSGEIDMCRVGDMVVTATHPIFFGGKWQFPCDVAKPTVQQCDAVYSVLLQRDDQNVDSHTFEIAGITAVTLGHGLTEEWEAGTDVRNNPFFGDYNKVENCMKMLPGWQGGLVECLGTVRDDNGWVVGFEALESEETIISSSGRRGEREMQAML